MSFLSKLFRRERRESVVFIDIGARRVAGAIACYVGKEIPMLVYTRVFAIEIQPNEDHRAAMLRAFGQVKDAIATEGTPALQRATSARHIDAVLISVDSPWQETIIVTEHLKKEREFIFTHALVSDVIKKVSAPVEGKEYTDVSVVGTFLNGYEVREPYGRWAHEASVTILTSLVDEQVAGAIHKIVRGISHTKRVALIAGTSLRYQAMRVAFAGEPNALILDATGPLPEVALVRNGFLATVAETPESLAMDVVTSESLTQCFAEIAKLYPLPRTVFLLARFDQIEAIKKTFEAMPFTTLWLTNNPPRLLPLTTTHMNGLVRQLTTNPPDLPLLLMALYWRYLEQPV